MVAEIQLELMGFKKGTQAPKGGKDENGDFAREQS